MPGVFFFRLHWTLLGMAKSPRGSPTELVDDDTDEELRSEGGEPAPVAPAAMSVDAEGVATGGTGGSPSRVKRARDPASDRRPSAGGGAVDRVLSPGDDRPVSSREFRSMLQQHLQAMTASWGEFSKRIEVVEKEHADAKRSTETLFSRVAQTERKQSDSEGRLAKLEKEVAVLREGVTENGAPSDPWQAYRAKNGPIPPKGGVNPVTGPGDVREQPARDELSEEDKRTLVLGGWSQDTKRQIIQDEARVFLQREDVKDLLDVSELTVYGPRRSFGLLRFQLRPGEGAPEVRNRMWQVIQALRNTPHRLQSVSAEGRPMWAQFTKTREARRRSAHGSMLRRVCLSIVRDAAQNKESHNVTAVEEGAYDVDWNSGTVWLGEWKIGSAVHRQPANNEDVRVLSSGWVDLAAASRALGVAWDLTHGAFEREL